MKVLLSALSITCLVFVTTHVVGQSPVFMLVREEADVKVFERWKKYPGKEPAVEAREVKGCVNVQSSIEDFFTLIQDEARARGWHPHVSRFKLFSTNDSLRWKEYACHDIPWPANDQESLFEYHVVEHTKRKLVIDFHSIEDNQLASKSKEVNRLEAYGRWEVEELSPGVINITYLVQSMPGAVPKMIADPFIRRNLVSSLRQLRELLETPSLAER